MWTRSQNKSLLLKWGGFETKSPAEGRVLFSVIPTCESCLSGGFFSAFPRKSHTGRAANKMSHRQGYLWWKSFGFWRRLLFLPPLWYLITLTHRRRRQRRELICVKDKVSLCSAWCLNVIVVLYLPLKHRYIYIFNQQVLFFRRSRIDPLHLKNRFVM